MQPPEKYRIIFYLVSGGAECRLEYGDKAEFDAATSSLNSRISALLVSGEGKHDPRSIYYVIGDDELAIFHEFMREESRGK